MEPDNRPTVDDILRDNRPADERIKDYVAERNEFLKELQKKFGVKEEFALNFSSRAILPAINIDDAYKTEEITIDQPNVEPATTTPEPEAEASTESSSNS